MPGMTIINTRTASAFCAGVVLCLFMLPGGGCAGEPNQLTQKEEGKGFQLLFDGKSMDNWTQRDGNWIIEDNAFCRAERGGSRRA